MNELNNKLKNKLNNDLNNKMLNKNQTPARRQTPHPAVRTEIELMILVWACLRC